MVFIGVMSMTIAYYTMQWYAGSPHNLNLNSDECNLCSTPGVMPQSSFALTRYRAFRGGPLGARYPYCIHTTVVPLRALYIPGVDSTVRGYWVSTHLNLSPGGSITPAKALFGFQACAGSRYIDPERDVLPKCRMQVQGLS